MHLIFKEKSKDKSAAKSSENSTSKIKYNRKLPDPIHHKNSSKNTKNNHFSRGYQRSRLGSKKNELRSKYKNDKNWGEPYSNMPPLNSLTKKQLEEEKYPENFQNKQMNLHPHPKGN